MLRIAQAQINTIVGNLEGNYYKIAADIFKARSVAADIVLFPEMAITGYPPEDLLYKNHFVRDNIRYLKKLVNNTANITAIIGFVDRDKDGRLYNAAAVIHDKKLKGVYHKGVLPNYSVFDERRYFVPGGKNKIFVLGKTAFGVSICEDIWADNGPCVAQSKAGAKVLFNISSSPFYAGKGRERERILKKCAKKNNIYVCYTNLVGGQDELVFDGGSTIIDPKGKVIAHAKQFDEDFIVTDLSVKETAKKAKRKGIETVSIPRKARVDSRLPIKGRVEKRLQSNEEIFKALTTGTYDYVQKNGFKKVVIGLSGGIDSSLVAVIATKALGKENVIGLSMPSQFSSAETKSDARKIADNLGIRLIEVPIESVFSAYLSSLSNDFANQQFNVAEENLQARIRGNLLMTYSNKFGWLVLTTGNKSEVAVGYCTLYGDMTGGFAVIQDVPKTTVYALSRYVNDKHGEIIPKSVLKRAPSAELRENQKDEDSLPAYELLDPILKSYVEEHRSLSYIGKKIKKNGLIKDVISMVDRSEYKRRQAPPGIKITPRAFGKDWRLPITNKYKEF